MCSVRILCPLERKRVNHWNVVLYLPCQFLTGAACAVHLQGTNVIILHSRWKHLGSYLSLSNFWGSRIDPSVMSSAFPLCLFFCLCFLIFLYLLLLYFHASPSDHPCLLSHSSPFVFVLEFLPMSLQGLAQMPDLSCTPKWTGSPWLCFYVFMTFFIAWRLL